MEWTTAPTEPGFYWVRNYKFTHPDDWGMCMVAKRFDPISGKPFMAKIDLRDLHQSKGDDYWYDDIDLNNANPNSRMIIGRKIDPDENYEMEFWGPVTQPKKDVEWATLEQMDIAKSAFVWVHNSKARYNGAWVGRLVRMYSQWSGKPYMVLIGVDHPDIPSSRDMFDPMDTNPDERKRKVIGWNLRDDNDYRFTPMVEAPPSPNTEEK